MELWPLLLYAFATLAVVVGMIVASFLLGERGSRRSDREPYESGISPTGDAGIRFPAQYHLVAMFFVIFDVEAVFLFAWAVSARELGWVAYTEAALFAAVLAIGLAYLWRRGGLDFVPDAPKPEVRR